MALLQDAINGASDGQTLNLAGQTFTDTATVNLNKRLKLNDGVLNSGATGGGFSAAISLGVDGLADDANWANVLKHGYNAVDSPAKYGSINGMAINAPNVSGIYIASRHNWALNNIAFAALSPILIWEDTQHILIEGCTCNYLTDGVTRTQSDTVLIRDDANDNELRWIFIRYCNFHAGTEFTGGSGTGWFGIEPKHADDLIIAHNILQGGNVLAGYPDSNNGHFHHNEIILESGKAYYGVEIAGPLTVNCTCEYNYAHGGTANFGTPFDHNSSPANINSIIRYNKVVGLDVLANAPHDVYNNYISPQGSNDGSSTANVDVWRYSAPTGTNSNNNSSQISRIILGIESHRSHKLANGEVVTLRGTGFGASQGGTVLSVGGVTQTPSSWSDTQIQFTYNQGAVGIGYANISLTDGYDFEVLITSSPSAGNARMGVRAGRGRAILQ